jgi:hypothetical protein
MIDGRILCVVEGEGERMALPPLIDRMLRQLRRHRRLMVDPDRVLCAHNGDRITAPYDAQRQLGIEFFVGRAAREKPAAIVVVVDAEQRCVQRAGAGDVPLGPHLLARARVVAGDIPVAVIVANRMFEAWLLADFHSLRSRGHLLSAAQFPQWQTPEARSGCKKTLTDALGRKYLETVDQERLARVVSLPIRAAMRARTPSFHKLYRDIDQISQEK